MNEQQTVAHHDLNGLALVDLRTLRDSLRDQEHQISYWRRIVHGCLDLLDMVEIDTNSALNGFDDLAEALAKDIPSSSAHRSVLQDTSTADIVPDLPDLEAVWSRPKTVQEAAALDLRLTALEKELSSRRRALHDQIDAATHELMRRYKDDPSLALSREELL